MTITYLMIGILIGFAMAIPLGPLGIMCIRNTLSKGHLQGFMIGLGAATADMIYSSIAAFGLTAISDGLDTYRILIRIFGGALLLFIGVRTFRTKSKDPKFTITNGGSVKSYISSLGITLTNPSTIFAFIAVFATFDLTKGITFISSSALVAGIFVGSSLWFLVLSSGVALFRNKLDLRGLNWANKIAGVLIFASGIFAVSTL